MNLPQTVWRELLQRRLLPVAILLIAALAAVAVLLPKDPAPVAPAAAPVNVAKDEDGSDALAKPVVSLVTDADHKERRRVLGASKNPFQPGPAPEPTATPNPLPQTVQVPGSVPGGTKIDTTGGSPVPSGGSTPAPPAVAPPAGTAPSEPKPRHELYSLTVRFGASEAPTLDKMNLPRLKALPSAEDPILVYLGLEGDGKTAVFLVDATAEPQGDGTCKPTFANCETIHMRVGDTEFFDVKDPETGQVTAQYQLDLLDIKRRTTTSAAEAAAARAKASKSGRRVLRARESESGPVRWRYDAKSGAVRRLDRKRYKAAVARMARAAMASAGGFDITR
jgi:hypothetical protein